MKSQSNDVNLFKKKRERGRGPNDVKYYFVVSNLNSGLQLLQNIFLLTLTYS